jgi:hypothetical protein
LAYVLEQLNELPYDVTCHEYGYLGWKLVKLPRLRVLAPGPREVHCQAFIYSAATPPGGIKGTIDFVGEHWIIGDYRWEKFAVRDAAGRTIAYISARPDGPAMPQPLSEFSEILPHFSIGEAEGKQFREWLASDQKIVVSGEIAAELDPAAKSKNIIASHSPPGSTASRIVLCAHLDSMYICPGANDNGGGVTALLSLARHYARQGLILPIDFIFFNGEEWDLAGAKAYVRDFITRDNARQIKFLFNLDGISEMADSLQVWVGPEGFEWDLKRVIDTFENARAVRKIYRFPPPLGADHVPFYHMGVPVVMMTGYDMVKYHLPVDTFWEGGVDNVLYVAELARHIIDNFGQHETQYSTRESVLAPYRDRAIESILSYKLL